MSQIPQKSPYRICWAGGGSGGHVYPIRSLIMYSLHNYQAQSIDHYRYGTYKSMEYDVCSQLQKSFLSFNKKKSTLTFVSLWSGKMRRERSWSAFFSNIVDIFYVIVGIIQSVVYLLRDKIDIVFCKGGYVALPVIIAARILSIPIIAHESDTHPGLVNRIAYRLAKKMYTGFDRVFTNAETVGQILSDDLLIYAQDSIQKKLKTDYIPLIDREIVSLRGDTVLVVTGGSLGARSLYDAIAELAVGGLDGYTIIIVGGLLNADIIHKISPQENRVIVVPSLSQVQIGEVYRYADLVVTRAGTTSLAEQQLFGVQQIIVPLDVTHDQADNARWYRKYYNAIVLKDDHHLKDHLDIELKKYRGYKKPPVDIEPLRHQCQIAKECIISQLVNNKNTSCN